MGRAERIDKFRACGARALPSATLFQVQDLIETLEDLADVRDVRELMTLLARPEPRA